MGWKIRGEWYPQEWKCAASVVGVYFWCCLYVCIIFLIFVESQPVSVSCFSLFLFSVAPQLPSSKSICLVCGRSESYQWLKKCGVLVAALPDAWHPEIRLVQCQYAVSGWDSKFDLQFLSYYAACKNVWADLSLRYNCCCGVNNQVSY